MKTPIDQNSIKVRKATETAFEDFYRIKSESGDIYWSGYLEKPDYDRLCKRYNEILTRATKSKITTLNEDQDNLPKLNEGKRDIYVIEADGVVVGYIYVDMIDDKTFELAIGVSEKASGRHIARISLIKIINSLRRINKQTAFVAWIRKDNLASSKAFEASCFVITDRRKWIWLPNIGKEIEMRQIINSNLE